MSMGNIIRELMEEKKMTQKELANEIKVTEASMSRYLKGERIPRIDVLVNIARVFNVSVEYLKGVEEVSGFDKIKRIVARNASSMTNEQKLELAKMLLKD